MWEMYDFTNIRKINIEILRKEINKKWVKTKIRNHIKKWGGMFKEEEIKNQIMENDLVASKFIKEPGKQSSHEIAACKYIQKIRKIDKIENLPSSTKTFFVNGLLTEDRGDSNVKSVDMELTYKGEKIYVFHKYTDVEGGSQDNQYNDVINCLNNAIGTKNKVIFICDGDYYRRKNRMVFLKNKQTSKVKVCNIYELESILDEFIE